MFLGIVEEFSEEESMKAKPRTLTNVGLDTEQAEYLVGMAQDCFAPSSEEPDFDAEVQRYLNAFAAEEENERG